MNRRELLAASAASTLLGTGGCIGALEPRDESRTDAKDVPDCAWNEEWTDDTTAGPTDPEPDSIAGRRDCADADRPEPAGDVCETFEVDGDDGKTTEFHSAGLEPYPAPPSDFDERTLRSFVSEYERAYAQNRAVSRHGENTVEFSFTTHGTEVVDGDDEISVIVIEFGFAFRTEAGSGTGGYHDAFSEAAIYGIDETGIVRIEPNDYVPDLDPEELPDPVEDGVLLHCF